MLTTRRFNKTFMAVFVALGLCLLMAATAGAQGLNFDHDFDTGYPLTGTHRTTSCESCHPSGIFKGAPKNCNGCHDGTIASGKSATHMNSSNNCADCHDTNVSTWIEIPQMDHGSATGTCSSCHDGTTATGKSATHINSSGHL